MVIKLVSLCVLSLCVFAYCFYVWISQHKRHIETYKNHHASTYAFDISILETSQEIYTFLMRKSSFLWFHFLEDLFNLLVIFFYFLFFFNFNTFIEIFTFDYFSFIFFIRSKQEERDYLQSKFVRVHFNNLIK